MGEFHGDVVTLWRREGELFFARPNGKAEERLATGKNPSVTLRESGAYAVWSTGEGIVAKSPGKPERVLSRTGAFAVLSPKGPVVAAWEDAGKIRMERLEP